MAYAIDSLDRNSAIRLAKSMRRKARNLEIKKGTAKKKLVRGAGALIGGAAAGAIMAPAVEEYNANQAAIEAGTMEDPRLMLGLPIDAWMALGAAAASYVQFGGEMVADGMEGFSLGIIGCFGRDLGASALAE